VETIRRDGSFQLEVNHLNKTYGVCSSIKVI